MPDEAKDTSALSKLCSPRDDQRPPREQVKSPSNDHMSETDSSSSAQHRNGYKIGQQQLYGSGE